MGKELSGYVRNRNTMRFQRDDLLQKLAGVERELDAQRQRTGEVKLVIDAIQRDVMDLTPFLKKPDDLKRVVRSFFHKYCAQPDPPEAVVSSFKAGEPGSPKRVDSGHSISGSNGTMNAMGNGSSSSSSGSSQKGGRRGNMFANVREQELRQRELQEKTLSTLQRKLAKQVAARESETRKLVDENVQLTKEVNTLRRELRLIEQGQPID
ncbi:hypothetical protein BCR44DRAFT_174245 [Catenaria anguillulae PL171]|uniref:Uncharacterized protein n=1 Tax=Catenaria anguillulae PL171 TaxID=765915 RepID=A0A1Y2HYB9_9FUNG|nr:hypothetical protein BCR44DRAFT_174245 [Catenaria anguillulae PL171]